MFISSHLMSEMELTANHLIIVGHGRVLADTSGERVDVTTPDAARLASLLTGPGVQVISTDAGALDITGVPASTIGELAAAHGLVLHQLTTRRLSLEEAFMQLTNETVDYHGSDGSGAP